MSYNPETSHSRDTLPPGFIFLGRCPIDNNTGDPVNWSEALVYSHVRGKWLNAERAAVLMGFSPMGPQMTAYDLEYAIQEDEDTLGRLLKGHEDRKYSLRSYPRDIVKDRIALGFEKTNDIPIYEL